MIKVGVIGLGVGEAHARAFQAIEDCSVTALCDIEPEKLSKIGKDFPQAKQLSDANQIIDDKEIDIVCIASFDNFHKDQVVASLSNKKHVFVEKPLCLTAEEAGEIRSALKENPELKLSSNLILRKSPRFIDLKQRLQGGELGSLSYVEGDYNYGRIHKITEGWRGKIPFYSVVLGGGLHLVDLILWLTGDRVESVSAMGNNIHAKGSQYKYSDLIAALLKFESGMVAKVASNYGCVHPHFHVLNLYGTEATFCNGLESAVLHNSRDPESESISIDSPYPGVEKGALVRNFVASVRGEEELEVSSDEVFEGLSVCLSIEKALSSGNTEKVKYL